MKDPSDPLKIVIVRDMWLTGFDAPCMHTLYVDKPMKGHGLMQAIARVNRVFKRYRFEYDAPAFRRSRNSGDSQGQKILDSQALSREPYFRW